MNQKINRYDYLDNIKWILTIIVILHHAAGVAGGKPVGYNLPSVEPSMVYQYDLLLLFQGINQSYFMSLFFFISAYFVTSSLERKGQRLFINDKFIRLGIPVLISLVVINPFIDNGFISNFADFFKTGNIDLGVTWFCWTLIVFSIVYSIVVNNKAMVEKRIDSSFPAVWIIIVFAFILIPLNYIFLYLQNVGGYNLMGFRSLGNFPAYIAMFYLGIQAYKYQWLDKLTVKHASVGICMWLFALITVFYLHAINSEYASSSYVLIRGFTAIGMSMFVLYVFKTFFNNNNYWTKRLSRTAFAAYVFQYIALYSVAKIYQPLMTQTPLINFVVVGIPSVIIAFALSGVICKTPKLKEIF
ncbi:acyltransferase family protein [Photobacterium angustum]|uniref:Acyltransferase n=1 Tax=Photobacterium angustum TaxID=661 RepID=A0A855S7D8_PHOAN|nr:acyltransferase [Photobacterium angustum]KJF83262.1 hypothetical protein UB36_01360 [Photobacterium damselae subsp. damselae]KJG42895.1 hypothetical protein UA35_02685 [Photobacterium angustum]KJG47570.1 hypothetical protein UA31_01360 [Photobacterium angustum]KJG50194.1 hypothetical protein UA30_06810 [Photobacterium angustum]KJG53729.1 hypothetical protein UA34_05330 [Photobacterium angustum]